MRYNLADYLANNWFKGDGLVLGGEKTSEIFRGLGYKDIIYRNDIFNGKLNDLSGINWVIVRKEDFNSSYSVSIASIEPDKLSISAYNGFNKKLSLVYNSDYINIFSG